MSGIDYKTYFALQYLFYASDATSYPDVAKTFKGARKLNGLMVSKSNPELPQWIDEVLAGNS